MSDWQIAANCRELFVEVAAASSSGSNFIRALNRKDNLSAGLLEALTLLPKDAISPTTKLILQTDLEAVVLREGWGEKAAFITTEGFENLMALWNEARAGVFGFQDMRTFPKSHPRQWIASDMTFGVGERVTPQGEVTQSLDQTEIDQLISKLKLAEVKTVGICFLHSNTNPTHEKFLKLRLENEGFEVFISSEHEGSERKRAKLTVGQCLTSHHIKLFQKPFLDMGFSPENIVWKKTCAPHGRPGQKDIHVEIYEDRTEVTLIDNGQVLAKKWLQTTLLSRVQYDPVGWVHVGPQKLLSEPGPVGFGKGLDLCFMDALILKHDLKVNGTSKIKADSLRAARAFHTVARQMKDNAESTSKHFYDLGVGQIASEIKVLFSDSLRDPKTKLRFQGPFGPILGKDIAVHLRREFMNQPEDAWMGALKLLDVTPLDFSKVQYDGDFSQGEKAL